MAIACGTPNPRILDSTEQARGVANEELAKTLTEKDKIDALIESVRRSKHIFVHDDIERTGEATAQKLKLLLERDPTGVRTAREFVERIASPEREDEPPDRVVLSEEESVDARHWFLTRLAELEGRSPPPTNAEQRRQQEVHARRLSILEALTIVERSDLRFVSPPRRAPAPKPKTGLAAKRRPKANKPSFGPKRKPKRKEYSGQQFAEMLRTKWEFLGADIQDLDTFIDEIASNSFAGMVRYRVVQADGSEEDFATWLRTQMNDERGKIAQGGAP